MIRGLGLFEIYFYFYAPENQKIKILNEYLEEVVVMGRTVDVTRGLDDIWSYILKKNKCE